MLSQALAPVLRALAVSQQREDSEGQRLALGMRRTRRETHQIPDIQYPAPVVVKNTFIDAEIGRPCSLEGFFEERAVRSTPVSRVVELDGAEEERGPPAWMKFGLAPPKEADSCSSCRSTSPGGCSERSSTGRLAEASPACLSEAAGSSTCRHTFYSSEEEENPVAGADSEAGGSSRRPSLPEFDYPAPLFVKNTFIHAEIGRPLSLDEFFEERRWESCPVSLVDREVEAVCPATPTSPRNIPATLAQPSASLLPDRPLMESASPWRLCIPPPPTEPPVLFAEQSQPIEPPVAVPAPPPPVHPTCGAVVLELSRVLEADLGLPSVGSTDHSRRTCRPCAHFHTSKGCNNGRECRFCHLCPPGELKRQQRVKRFARKTAVA